MSAIQRSSLWEKGSGEWRCLLLFETKKVHSKNRFYRVNKQEYITGIFVMQMFIPNCLLGIYCSLEKEEDKELTINEVWVFNIIINYLISFVDKSDLQIIIFSVRKIVLLIITLWLWFRVTKIEFILFDIQIKLQWLVFSAYI